MYVAVALKVVPVFEVADELLPAPGTAQQLTGRQPAGVLQVAPAWHVEVVVVAPPAIPVAV